MKSAEMQDEDELQLAVALYKSKMRELKGDLKTLIEAARPFAADSKIILNPAEFALRLSLVIKDIESRHK